MNYEVLFEDIFEEQVWLHCHMTSLKVSTSPCRGARDCMLIWYLQDASLRSPTMPAAPANPTTRLSDSTYLQGRHRILMPGSAHRLVKHKRLNYVATSC
jgi:hypothetical protein